AVIHGDVVKNPRNKSFAIDFYSRDVKLRGIGQGQVSVLLLFIGNLEWRPPDITAVQRDVIKFRRQGGAVGIHQICQAPVVDCLAIVFRANLRALRTHPELEDRKSTRLNSSHVASSYAVSCLKKKSP